ncbi:MAG TPA: SAM-dependent methyltransferase [Acidimicrobiia bacterium]|nr:SAM-dependent methyltransferase [Acidimicrobiia bacterium]
MAEAKESDWVAWHQAYDAPGSVLARRLVMVQEQLRVALDRAPSGVVRVLSLCAGQGRDVLGVLATHPRASDVTARLIELNPELADRARADAEAHGLDVEVRTADAGLTDGYVGAVPTNVVVACGIFGHVSDEGIREMIGTLDQLCAAGASVLWTRHRNPPDLTPAIRRWFTEAGFEELSFEILDDDTYVSVGHHASAGPPAALQAGRRLFTFVG